MHGGLRFGLLHGTDGASWEEKLLHTISLFLFFMYCFRRGLWVLQYLVNQEARAVDREAAAPIMKEGEVRWQGVWMVTKCEI